MNRLHVHPLGDLVQHDLDSEDCVCGPTVRPVMHDDGSIGWLILHHALDGREKTEPGG